MNLNLLQLDAVLCAIDFKLDHLREWKRSTVNADSPDEIDNDDYLGDLSRWDKGLECELRSLAEGQDILMETYNNIIEKEMT